ncbi:hypothetical protein AVEN_167010-1 [Araneus ventricosus]|uniref:Uncharacterized protein n=1 Tax=Araneus ventricosus TaxID=182803 RepID=A0A4Y2VHE4_ARAVE|nr:hypothetical protein AVEN_167010-1 [Araneus ventricosus]
MAGYFFRYFGGEKSERFKMAKMLCLRDFEEYAKNSMDRRSLPIWTAGSFRTPLTRAAFIADAIVIDYYLRFSDSTFVPRWLRSKEERGFCRRLFWGETFDARRISPMASQRLAHPDGEEVAAREETNTFLGFALEFLSECKKLVNQINTLPRLAN